MTKRARRIVQDMLGNIDINTSQELSYTYKSETESDLTSIGDVFMLSLQEKVILRFTRSLDSSATFYIRY